MLDNYHEDLYSTFAQALLYGIYITTLIHCLRWLLLDDEGWRLRRRIDWPMLIISILLFLLLTTDLAIMLRLVIDYPNLNGDTIKSVLEGATLLIVDGVLIYRLWMVYFKSWRITGLPITLWLGCLACVFLLNSDRTRLTILQELYIVVAFYACNISVNLYATSLIVYRILRVAYDNKAIRKAGYPYRTTRILAESGILYTMTSIFSLTAQLGYKYIPGFMGDTINNSTAGIAFNLIVIRVGQNRRDRQEMIQSRLDTQWVKMELLALQSNIPRATPQDQSLAATEEGKP